MTEELTEEGAIKIFEEVEAILRGHFVYTSGKHGEVYVNKDAVSQFPAQLSILAEAIADHFFGEADAEVVVGPAVGAIALAEWVGYHYGSHVLVAYTEDEFVEHEIGLTEDGQLTLEKESAVKWIKVRQLTGRKVLKRGFAELVNGKRVLLVEDILTTGGSAKASMEAIQRCGGEVVGVGVLWNRGGMKPEDVGLPSDGDLFAVVNKQFASWPEEECPLCRDRVPVNTDVGHGKEWLKSHPDYPRAE